MWYPHNKGDRTKVEIFHASKYGNGKRVAEEIQRTMVGRGHQVDVHHIREARPKELPRADLYIIGTPARIGRPIGQMRRFTKRVRLPAGTKYALFATHGAPRPDKKTGQMPTVEEQERWYTSIAVLTEILAPQELVKVADMRVLVKDIQGPLEEGWETKGKSFVDMIETGTAGHVT
jgi:flavodoxin